MEEINTVEELLKDNPDCRLLDIHVIADAIDVYEEASDNVKRNGAIVAHPRTGVPIENPYINMQHKTGVVIQKNKRVKCDRVVTLIRNSYKKRKYDNDE